jgi:hypothetical protein
MYDLLLLHAWSSTINDVLERMGFYINDAFGSFGAGGNPAALLLSYGLSPGSIGLSVLHSTHLPRKKSMPSAFEITIDKKARAEGTPKTMNPLLARTQPELKVKRKADAKMVESNK